MRFYSVNRPHYGWFIVCSLCSHKTSTKLFFLFSPSVFSQLGLSSKIIQPRRDKNDICFTFQKSLNKPAFHPSRKFHKKHCGDTVGRNTASPQGTPAADISRNLGPLQPQQQQQQLVLSLNAAQLEITQVAELFVSLTVPLWGTEKWKE